MNRMVRRTEVESQWTNLLLFRAWMPWGRAARDGLRLATRYLGDGRTLPFPVTVNVNVTNRCNLDCDYCYNRDGNQEHQMATSHLEALIGECARHRAGVFLSGGEPLTRADVPDLLAMAKRHGLPAGLATNGMLLTSSILERLVADRVDLVMLSFRGDEAAHDAFVKRPGSYRRMLESLRYLAQRLPPPGPVVHYVVTAESMPGIRRFLADMLPLRNVVVRLTHLSFADAADVAAHEAAWTARLGAPVPPLCTFRTRIDPRAFDDLPRLLADPAYGRILSKPVLSPDEARAWYAPGYRSSRRCLFVWHSTNIDADGTVVPCQYYPLAMGNIRDQSLADIWNGERYKAFRREIRRGLFPGCARCCKL